MEVCKMIIYKVTNLVNNKVYIGQTSRGFEVRKKEHLRHINDSIYFHSALKKYGVDNFIWEVIDDALTQDELNCKEIKWIEYYNSFGKNGYNLTKGGDTSSGYKHSDETKKKISEKNIKSGVMRGSNSSNSKLTEEEVIKIKKLIKEGYPLIKIAKMFKVDDSTIGKIKSGKHWKHIGEDVSYVKYKNRKLTEDIVKEIKLLLKKGLTHKEIAILFNVTIGTIGEIKLGKTWKTLKIE
jgi:group I intron endonuclease